MVEFDGAIGLIISIGKVVIASRAMLKHNIYFDGNVQSVGFARLGRDMSVGVIEPGEYRFGTEAAERMTVVSGEFLVKVGDDWRSYPAGSYFEIEGNSGFDVRVTGSSAYLCEYL